MYIYIYVYAYVYVYVYVYVCANKYGIDMNMFIDMNNHTYVQLYM